MEKNNIRPTTIQEEECLSCDKKAPEDTFYAFILGGSRYHFCGDCIDRDRQEFDSFLEFLRLKYGV